MPRAASSNTARRTNAAKAGFEADAQGVLAKVQSAFTAMIAEARCGSAQTAAELERALGLDKKLGWQVYRVVNAPNAMAAGFAVPSAVSTRRLVAAARKRGASAKAASRVEKAVDQFDLMVREHADDRLEFESMIADWSSEGREPVELLSRRALFAAMSKLRGSAMTTMLNTVIVHPSRDGAFIDRAILMGYFGLRRLRSTARLGAGTLWYPDVPTDEQERTIDEGPITDPLSALLPGFCSRPTPDFEIIRTETGLQQFWLGGNDVGLRTAADVVLAFRRNRSVARYATPERPTAIHSLIPSTPTRRLIFDCIVHADLHPPADPQVMVHEAAGNGPVGTHVEYANRKVDMQDWRPAVRFMGQGIDQFRAAWVPRYAEMLHHVCRVTGWNPRSFRGYRVEVEYPVHSWQISLAFEKFPPADPRA